MGMTIPDFDRILTIGDDFVSRNPDATAADAMNELRRVRELMLHLFTETQDVCANCGRPVVVQDERWMHLKPSGLELSNRGCRAASYDWLQGTWDDDLDKGLQAKPKAA